MYKILLAEDEPQVLQSMIETIDWAAYGFAPPVGCANGREAIEQVQGGFVPHAVITDICMPLADGLELASYLYEHHPQVLTVILSGYDDFAYAQRALRMQVHDYVLKPVTPKRMQELLARIAGDVRQRQLAANDDTHQLGRNEFLAKLLAGPMDEDKIAENLQRYSLPLEGRFCLAVAMDIDPTGRPEERGDGGLDLLRYGLHNILCELAAERPNTAVAAGKRGLSWLVMTGQDAKTLAAEGAAAAQSMVDVVQTALGLGVSAGVGHVQEGLEALCQSRESAQVALGGRLYHGGGAVLLPEDGETAQSAPFGYADYEKHFEQRVQAFDNEGALAVIGEMFAGMAAARIPFDRCVKYSQRLVLLLLRFAGGYLGGEELKALEAAWEEHDLNESVFISQMEQLVKQYCQQVFELLALVYNDSAAAQIMRAESFIRQNLANPKLSLQMVTDHLAVSTSYFSSLFKSRTGATFVEYLTRLRMDKAKQILAHTERRTYEVAEDVGYSDPHYFSAAFKRATGATPKEFREQSKRRQQGGPA